MPGSTYRPQYDSYGNPIPPAGGAETPRYGTGTDPVTGADTYYRLYEGADGNYYEQLMPGVNAPVPSPGLGGVAPYSPNQFSAGINANLLPQQTDPSVMGRAAQQELPYPDYYQHAPTEQIKITPMARLNNFLNDRTPYTHPFEGRVKSEVDYYDPSAASQYEPSGATPQIKDASGNPLDKVYYNDIDPTYIANILGYDVRVPGGERWTLQDAVDRGVFSVAEAQQLYRMQQYTPAGPGNLAGALGAFAVGQDVIKYDPATGAGATEPYQGAYLSTEDGFADAVGNVTNTVSGAVAEPFNAASDKLNELGWYDSGFVNAVNEWDENASQVAQDKGGQLAGGVIATIGNVPIINATMRGVDQTANNVSGGTAENLGEFIQGNPLDVFTNGSNAVYKIMAIRAANERWGEETYAVPDRFPDRVSEAASYPLRQGIGRAQGNVNGDDFYNWLLNDAQGRQALEQFASPTRSDASGMLLPIDSKALEEAYLADQGLLGGMASGYAMDPTSLADALTIGLGGAGLAARGAGMARLGTGLLRASRLADTAGVFGLDWAIEKAGGKALWMLLPDTVKRQRIAMAQDEMATGIRAIITSENSAVRTAGGGTPVGVSPSAATPGGAPGRAATGTPIPAIRNVGPNNPSIAAAQASPAGAAPLTQLTNNGFSQSPLSTTSPRPGIVSQAVNITHNNSGLMYMINATVPQNVDVIDNAINPQAMAWVPYFKDPSTGLYHRIGSRPMTLDQAGQQIGYHTNQRLLDEAEGLADEALGGADVADDAAAALPGRSLSDSGLIADEMPTYQRVGNGHVDRKIYGVKNEDGSANYALVAERQTPRQGDRNNGVMWVPDPEERIWRAYIADSSGAPQGRHIAPHRSRRNTRAEAEQMIIEAERRRASGFSVSNEMDNPNSEDDYDRLFMQWWESITPAEREAFNRGELDGPTLFELENLANRQGTESLDNLTDIEARREDLLRRMGEVVQQLNEQLGRGNDQEFNRLNDLFNSLTEEFDGLLPTNVLDADEINRGMDEALRRAAGLRDRLEPRDPSGDESLLRDDLLQRTEEVSQQISDLAGTHVLGERYWDIVAEVGSPPTSVSNVPGNGIGGNPVAVDMRNGGVAWFDPDTGAVVYFGNREEGYQQYLYRYTGPQMGQVLGERYWDIVEEVGSTPTNISNFPDNGINGSPTAVDMQDGGVAWFDPDTGEVVYVGNKEEGYRQYRDRYTNTQQLLDAELEWLKSELDGPVYPSRVVNGKQRYSIPEKLIDGMNYRNGGNIELEIAYNSDGTAKFLVFEDNVMVKVTDKKNVDKNVMSVLHPDFQIAQKEAQYKIATFDGMRNEILNSSPKDVVNKLSLRNPGKYGYQSRLEELVVNLVKGISRPTPPLNVRPGHIGRQLSGQMEVGKEINGITIKSDEPLSEDAIHTHAMTKWWEAVGANDFYYDQVFWYSDDYELFKLWWSEASPEERIAYATTPEPKEHYYKASADASLGVVADWRQYLDGPGKLFGRLTPKWETPRRLISQEKFNNAAVRSIKEEELPDDERNQFYESVMEAYHKWFSEASNDEIDLYIKGLSPGPHINTPIKIQEMFSASDKAKLQYVFPREDTGGGQRVPDGFDLKQSANIDPQPGNFSLNNVVDDTPHVNTAVTPETLSRKKNILSAVNYLGQRRQAIGSDTITGRVANALGSNSSQATMEHGAWRVSLFIDNIEAQARATGATVRQLIAENTDHELWHAMRQIGAISDEDHAVIVDWARKAHPMPQERIDRYREIWEREKDRASAYYASWEDFIEEEEAAYAIGMWAKGKYGAPVHPARKALEQFYDFVDKLASYFRSTPSARTVRRNWDQGKYAASGVTDETKVVNAIATAEREMVERRVKLVRTGNRQAQQAAGYRKKFARPSEANVISPSETKVFGDADHVTTYDPAREVYVVTRMSDGETTLIHKDMMNGNTPEGIQAMGAQAIRDRDAARVKAEEDRFDQLRTEVRGMVSNGQMENEEVFTQSEIKALIDRGDITPTPGSALDRFAKGEPFNKLEYDEAIENLRGEISAALKKTPVQGGSTADDAADAVRSPLQRIIGKDKNGKPNIRWFAKTEPGKLVPNGAVDGSLEADIETLKNMTTEEWASKEGERLRRKHLMNPTGEIGCRGARPCRVVLAQERPRRH